MIDHCEHCGAGLKKFWHKITPGLVDTLVKAYMIVSAKGKNIVNRDELNLSNSAYTNMYKLRYHGLIAHYKIDGQISKGEWLITRRGGQFLRGEIDIPARVQTFRNKVIAHDEHKMKLIDVLGMTPYFEKNFEFEFANDEDLENVPVIIQDKKKKKKSSCPVCGDKLDVELQDGEGKTPGSVSIRKFLVCQNKAGCSFRQEVGL